MERYYEQKIMSIKKQIEVFGESEERKTKLEVFTEKLNQLNSKYEGFKVSKEVENKSKKMEREFKARDIMEFQSMLEMHNKSLGNFMVNKIEYDWNKNPLWVALYNILKATMIQGKDGYWTDK